MNSELVKQYLETYFPDVDDEDEIKNEKKKIHNLLKKINKAESVFKELPFECLNLNEQAKLIHFILEESDERQIIGNMGKVDADKDFSNIEIEDKEAEIFTHYFLEEEMPNYESLDIKSVLISNRRVIRSEQDVQVVLDYLNQSNENIIISLMNEINGFYMMGLCIENLTYIKEYIDCVINDILQLVVYKVMSNSGVNTATILRDLSEEVRDLSENLNNELNKKRKVQRESDILTASQVMRYFSAYLKHRSRLQEEMEIYEELEKEKIQNSAIFNIVPYKYEAAKIFLAEEDLKNSAAIITEDKSIYRYNEKMSTVREFIEFMRDYGGRQCYPNCLQDLKVYFREIYMSKAKYRRQQAHSIVEDFLEKLKLAKENKEPIPEFNKQSQYLFVREKISRGYFREKGLLSDYYDKVKFTNEFYCLLLKVYSFYDFKDAINYVYKVNCNLLRKLGILA